MSYKKWILICFTGVAACGISFRSTACEMNRSPVCEMNKAGQASFSSRSGSAVMASSLSSDVPLTKEKMKRKR